MFKRNQWRNAISPDSRVLWYAEVRDEMVSHLSPSQRSEFMNKLDTNPHLICFQNGILDLQENKFRKGYSDDSISLSIDMIFSTPSTKKQKQDLSIILDNFHDFRRKIINMRKNKLVFSV